MLNKFWIKKADKFFCEYICNHRLKICFQVWVWNYPSETLKDKLLKRAVNSAHGCLFFIMILIRKPLKDLIAVTQTATSQEFPNSFASGILLNALCTQSFGADFCVSCLFDFPICEFSDMFLGFKAARWVLWFLWVPQYFPNDRKYKVCFLLYFSVILGMELV